MLNVNICQTHVLRFCLSSFFVFCGVFASLFSPYLDFLSLDWHFVLRQFSRGGYPCYRFHIANNSLNARAALVSASVCACVACVEWHRSGVGRPGCNVFVWCRAGGLGETRSFLCWYGSLNLPSGTCRQWSSDTHRLGLLSNELLGARKNYTNCSVAFLQWFDATIIAKFCKKKLQIWWYAVLLCQEGK